MAIIDFGELEKPITEIEKVLKEHNLEEKQLIMKNLQGRLNKQITDLRAEEVSNNVLSKIPLSGLLKKFSKKKEDEE